MNFILLALSGLLPAIHVSIHILENVLLLPKVLLLTIKEWILVLPKVLNWLPFAMVPLLLQIFFGGGGYTLITYCHIDPNFLVSVGDTVVQGQVIAHVGPKYVTGVKNNPYQDKTRKSNQWCYHWSPSPSWHSPK